MKTIEELLILGSGLVLQNSEELHDELWETLVDIAGFNSEMTPLEQASFSLLLQAAKSTKGFKKTSDRMAFFRIASSKLTLFHNTAEALIENLLAESEDNQTEEVYAEAVQAEG